MEEGRERLSRSETWGCREQEQEREREKGSEEMRQTEEEKLLTA